jgi:hypothetical protein
MATDLSLWFCDLLRFESSDQEPDWEELEEALVDLQERVEEQDRLIEALEPEDPMREPLFLLGDHLHQVCQQFEQFLETGDYQFLRSAQQLALEMVERRQELRRQLDDESHGQRIEI